jgi:surface protein
VADVSKIEITRAGGQAETYDFKDPNAVRYTAQTLTDAQKTQARTNIGAAASDNKLRLGQICGITDATSSSGTKSFYFYQGFINLLASSDTTSIVFSSQDVGSQLLQNLVKAYLFEDFIGYRTAVSTVTVAPLKGRTAGKTKTGAWIHVESCYYMFYLCSGITSLDLSMFDTSEVKDMTAMFSSCTALTNLNISSFDMTNVVNRDSMFGSNSKTYAGITTLKCPKINPHTNIKLPRTLYSQDGTAYTNLPVTTGTSIELRASWT